MDGQCTTAQLLARIDLLAEFSDNMSAVHRGVGTPLDYALNVSPKEIVASLRRHGGRTSR
jgi:hypothetical protein